MAQIKGISHIPFSRHKRGMLVPPVPYYEYAWEVEKGPWESERGHTGHGGVSSQKGINLKEKELGEKLKPSNNLEKFQNKREGPFT